MNVGDVVGSCCLGVFEAFDGCLCLLLCERWRIGQCWFDISDVFDHASVLLNGGLVTEFRVMFH